MREGGIDLSHPQVLEKGGIPCGEPWEKLRERAQLNRWGAEGVAVGKCHHWKSQWSRPAKRVRGCLNGRRSHLGGKKENLGRRPALSPWGILLPRQDADMTVSLWDAVTSRKQDIQKVYDTMCLFHWIASLIKVPKSQGFPGSSSSKTLLPAPSAGVQVPEMAFHMLQLRPGPVK